uniref:Uncharacterized protein n=1 Tax=Strigamia maritima TaxID=126957 RepID=T1IRS4_STRMM
MMQFCKIYFCGRLTFVLSFIHESIFIMLLLLYHVR